MGLLAALDEQGLDAIFGEVDQCHLPGAAVGIAIGGAPVYRKAFGLASLELPVQLSPSMRMRIYSVTKHFTALAYMLLCEEGKARLDDPVGLYLPELHPATHSATMRQLMGHVSGLRDAFDVCYQFSGVGSAVSSAEILALYGEISDRSSGPDEVWQYNNGGYLILTAAVERLCGKPLDQVLRERILGPAGMHDTFLRPADTDFVANSATLHTRSRPGQFAKTYLGTAASGEGGLVSTVDDLLRWMKMMDSARVGMARTWEVMRAPLMLKDGASTGYGLGLWNQVHRGIRVIHHSGGGLGGTAQVVKVPQAGLDAVVITNRDDVTAMDLACKVLGACVPDLSGVRLEKQQEQRAAGGPPEELRVHTSSAIAGRYRCASIGVEVLIGAGENEVRLRTFGHFGSVVYRLEHVAGEEWRMQSDMASFLGGTLRFRPDGCGFRLATYRTPNLVFDRCA